MGNKPSIHHTIERVNNDGNYEPSNCKWATFLEQSRNKTTTVRLTLDGRPTYQAALARLLNVNPHTVEYHLGRGKNADQIRDYFQGQKC